jgi:hypothetical protein
MSVYCAYSLHYVGGAGSGDTSADYFGRYCNALAKLQNTANHDPPFVALMANSTRGDVNNINFRSPRPSQPPSTKMQQVAEDVAAKVNAALGKVEWKGRAPLDARFRELQLAWRPIDQELDALLQMTAEVTAKSESK